jgi:hypothetical protein
MRIRGVRRRRQTRPNNLRRSAAELWGNHEVTGEYDHSSGGAEPIASPRRIDQRAVGGSRPFRPGRSRPARLWETIPSEKRHKQQKIVCLSQNFHDGRRAPRSMASPADTRPRDLPPDRPARLRRQKPKPWPQRKGARTNLSAAMTHPRRRWNPLAPGGAQ